MIFGDTRQFAAEAEFTSQSGSFIYGRFRVWVGGSPIGTFSEEVLNLLSTTGVLRRPVPPASSAAAALGPQQLLEKVWSVAFVDPLPASGAESGSWNADSHRDWSCYVWFESCEGFENVRSVIANIGNSHRIVWRVEGDMTAREFLVPVATYDSVATAFIMWLDRGLLERRERGDG